MMEIKINFQSATLLQRVKALVIDAVVLVLLMILFSKVLDLVGDISDTTSKILLASLFLYDPLFTSLFGGTLGHLIIGIRVKRLSNPQKNIIFPLAILRYFLKTCLGWISLLTVTGNKNKQAIHDLASGSIVRLKS